MRVADILEPERIAVDVAVTSKKGVLEKLAQLLVAGNGGDGASEVFDNLVARERLGSTGLGHGVAIPHCRAGRTDRPRGALVRTAAGVDFDAIDGQPVDLFFGLSVPLAATQEHLDLLAELAAMFSDAELTARLRDSPGAQEIYRLLAAWQPPGRTARASAG